MNYVAKPKTEVGRTHGGSMKNQSMLYRPECRHLRNAVIKTAFSLKQATRWWARWAWLKSNMLLLVAAVAQVNNAVTWVATTGLDRV
jgi:hypothetical protein